MRRISTARSHPYRVARLVAHHQGSQLVDELPASHIRERRDAADIAQRAVVVVEADEERSDADTALVDAVAERDDVGGARVLDLQHGALVRLVGVVETLGDDTVETRALELREPASGGRGIVARAGQVHRRLDARKEVLELGATAGERSIAQIAVAARQQVEGDEQGGRLVGELRDPGGGGVDALAQSFPVPAVARPEDPSGSRSHHR